MAHDSVRQRRLSRAVWSHEGVDLSWKKIKGEVIQDFFSLDRDGEVLKRKHILTSIMRQLLERDIGKSFFNLFFERSPYLICLTVADLEAGE